MTGPSHSALPLETLDKERVLHPATSIADHLVKGVVPGEVHEVAQPHEALGIADELVRQR